MTRLSIIIPAYGCLPDVMQCQRSVIQTTDPALSELLIQDDASPDYNGPALFGEVCQRNPVNLGFPGNCNTAALRAVGDLLLFLNQDTVALTPQWDAGLIEFFDTHPQVGIVGLTLLFPDGSIQSVGGRFDGACQPFHEALGMANPDWECVNQAREVSWTTGGALAVRRDVWQRLGGFDLAYGRGYFEDVDFCVRAALAGWQTWHFPGARFTHRVGSTGGNPRFAENGRLFRQRWIDTGIVLPDIQARKVALW